MRNLPRISCSLLGAEKKNIPELLPRLEYIGIDMIHYDVCDDKPALDLQDIPAYQQHTRLPFDVHLTVARPDEYVKELAAYKVEYCSIHIEVPFTPAVFEKLRETTGCRIGLACNIETSVDDLAGHLSLADFVLCMAAEPGMSGGEFGRNALTKVRMLRRRYPDLPIHVDGGINRYSATLLRELKVDVLVSGSYILNSQHEPAIQVAELFGRNLLLKVSDLLQTLTSFPTIYMDAPLRSVAEEVTLGQLGAVCVLDEKKHLVGLITDYDLRMLFFRDDDIFQLRARDIMNPRPISISADATLLEALRTMEDRPKAISLLPVVDENHTCIGLIRIQDLLRANVL